MAVPVPNAPGAGKGQALSGSAQVLGRLRAAPSDDPTRGAFACSFSEVLRNWIGRALVDEVESRESALPIEGCASNRESRRKPCARDSKGPTAERLQISRLPAKASRAASASETLGSNTV